MTSATTTCPNVVVDVDVDVDGEEATSTATTTSTPLIETLANILPRGNNNGRRNNGSRSSSSSSSSDTTTIPGGHNNDTTTTGSSSSSSSSSSSLLVYDWMEGNDPSRYVFSVILTWVIVSSVLLVWIVLLIVIPKLRHRCRRQQQLRQQMMEYQGKQQQQHHQQQQTTTTTSGTTNAAETTNPEKGGGGKGQQTNDRRVDVDLEQQQAMIVGHQHTVKEHDDMTTELAEGNNGTYITIQVAVESAGATTGGSFLPDGATAVAAAEEEGGKGIVQTTLHRPLSHQRLQIDCNDDVDVDVDANNGNNDQSLDDDDDEEEQQQQQHHNVPLQNTITTTKTESPSHTSSVRWWREKQRRRNTTTTNNNNNNKSTTSRRQLLLYSKMSDDNDDDEDDDNIDDDDCCACDDMMSTDYNNNNNSGMDMLVVLSTPPSIIRNTSSSSSTGNDGENNPPYDRRIQHDGSMLCDDDDRGPNNHQQNHDDDGPNVETTTTTTTAAGTAAAAAADGGGGLYFPSPPPPPPSLHAFVTSPSPVVVLSSELVGTSKEHNAKAVLRNATDVTAVVENDNNGDAITFRLPPPPASPSPSLGSISIDEQSSRYLSYCLSSSSRKNCCTMQQTKTNNSNNTSGSNNNNITSLVDNVSNSSSVESSFNLLSDDDNDDDHDNDDKVNESGYGNDAGNDGSDGNDSNNDDKENITSSVVLSLNDENIVLKKNKKQGDSLLYPQLDAIDDTADDMIMDDEQQDTTDAQMKQTIPTKPIFSSKTTPSTDRTSNDLSLLATSKANNKHSTSFDHNKNFNNMMINAVDSSFPQSFHEDGLFLFVHHDNNDGTNDGNKESDNGNEKSHHHSSHKNGDYFISIRSPSKKNPSSPTVFTLSSEQPATSVPTVESNIEDITSQALVAENCDSTRLSVDDAAVVNAAAEAPKKNSDFQSERESCSVVKDPQMKSNSETHQYQQTSLRKSNFTSDAAAKKREIEQFLSSFRPSSNSVAIPTTTAAATTTTTTSDNHTAKLTAQAASNGHSTPPQDNVEVSQPMSPLTEISNESVSNSNQKSYLLEQQKNRPVPIVIDTNQNQSSSQSSTPEVPIVSPASQWINQWLARVFVSPRNEQDEEDQVHQQTGTFDTEESDDANGQSLKPAEEMQNISLPASPCHTESSEGTFVYIYRRRVHCYRYITLVACTLVVISTLLFGLNGFWNLQNELTNAGDSWSQLQSKNLMVQNDLQKLQDLLLEDQIDQEDNALHQSLGNIRSLLHGHCPKVSFGVCPQDRRKLTDSHRGLEDRFSFESLPSEVDVVSASDFTQEGGPSSSVNAALPSLDITGGSEEAFSSLPKDIPRSPDSLSIPGQIDFSTCEVSGIPLEDLWNDWIARVTTNIASTLDNDAESWLTAIISSSDFFMDEDNNAEVDSGINAWDWALWGALAANICISILAFAIMWSVVATSHDDNWVNTRRNTPSTSASNGINVTTMPQPFWCCTPTLFSIGYWLLFALAWLFGLCFSVGTVLTVDSCYQDDINISNSTMIPSSNSVFTEVLRRWEENHDGMYAGSDSPISISDYWIYHINGCPAGQFPTSIRDGFLVGWNDVFESTGVLVRNLDALPQSIYQDICGASSAPSKQLLVDALTSFQDQSCQILQSFSQLQSDLSCQQWQPTLQQDLIVESICQGGANGLVWVTGTQVMILLMGLLIWTFRVTFMPVRHLQQSKNDNERVDEVESRPIEPSPSPRYCCNSFRRQASSKRISRRNVRKDVTDYEEEGDHVGLMLSSRRSYADESLNAALSGSYDNGDIISSTKQNVISPPEQ